MGEYIPEQPPERSREPVGMCRVRPLQLHPTRSCLRGHGEYEVVPRASASPSVEMTGGVFYSLSQENK